MPLDDHLINEEKNKQPQDELDDPFHKGLLKVGDVLFGKEGSKSRADIASFYILTDAAFKVADDEIMKGVNKVIEGVKSFKNSDLVGVAKDAINKAKDTLGIGKNNEKGV